MKTLEIFLVRPLRRHFASVLIHVFEREKGEKRKYIIFRPVLFAGGEADRLVQPGVHGQPAELHRGGLRERRQAVRVRVGRGHQLGDRVGPAGGQRVRAVAAQVDQPRLHRAPGRTVLGAGAASVRGQRAVPDVPDQQPHVRDRLVQPATGLRAGHRHRLGPETGQDRRVGHGRRGHRVLPVPRPGRRVRVGHGPGGRLLRPRTDRAGPAGRRRAVQAGHAGGSRAPRRRPVDTGEQLSRLHSRHGRLLGRQRAAPAAGQDQ